MRIFKRIKNSVNPELKRKIKLLFYMGNRYVCPICGYHSRNFAFGGEDSPASSTYHIIGAGKRRCGCLKCESSDRERLVFLYLKEVERLFCDNFSGKVLHIAPEKEIARHFLNQKQIDYIAGDYFAEGYKYPSYVRKINALCLPFSDETFDLLICNHVLEHIEDDYKAMSEFYRVLKKGKKAILQVPISYVIPHTIENPNARSPKERFGQFGQSDHVRIYGSDYKHRLEAVGFKVELFRFPDDTINKYGLNKEENLYICHK